MDIAVPVPKIETTFNNYWGEFPDIEGYNGLGYTEEETKEGYEYGKGHLVNYTIVYKDRMKEYISRQYAENYPNEMALCLEGTIVDNVITIYGYSPVKILYQDENSVHSGCTDGSENTIVMHSHTDIQRVWNMCYPSEGDVSSWYDYDAYEMIACGVGKDITSVIAYRTD